MGKQLGRNEPCWCGSGIKYKRCHLDRDSQTPATIQEALNKFRTVYGQRYCLHPSASNKNCSGNIVKAHTIQRNGGLSRIARNGHVYHFMPNFTVLNKTNGMTRADLIGIGQASTFTGFCGLHDNRLFEPIEKNSFQSNQQHPFLLAYRALCKEIFLKKASLEMVPYQRSLDRGRSRAEQVQLQQMLNAWEYGVSNGLKLLEHHKTAYDNALLNSDFSSFRYYIIRLDCVPDFLCSSITQPEYNFSGELLQAVTIENMDTFLDHFTFSIIATDSGGAIVFGWLGKSNTSKRLVDSLHRLPDSQVPHAITRFTFEYFENLYASPSWWEGLNETVQQRLLERIMTEVHPDMNRTPDCLIDDGLRVVSWTVTGRETNLKGL